MVAQKRAASRQQGAANKAAKKEDRFTEDCAAVLTLLDRDSALNEVTRSMLQKALPHALSTTGTERHDFQKTLIEALSGVFKGVEAQSQSASDAASTKVEEATKAVGEVTEAEKTASTQVEEMQSKRDGSDTALQEAANTVSTATSSLEKVQTQEGNLKGDYDKAVSAHGEHEAFLKDAWVPLKAGNWPGKQWRERNKLIEKLQLVFETLQMEDSLRKSLPIALKAKVEERGAFAASSIEFTEKDLHDHLAALKKEIDGHDDKVVECRKSVEAAELALKEAQGVQDSRASVLVEAENALSEAKEAHKSSKESVKAAKLTESSLTVALEAAKAEVASIKELLTKFEVLCEHGSTFPAETAAPVTEQAVAAE